MHMYMHMYMYVCMYVCIYIYIYVLTSLPKAGGSKWPGVTCARTHFLLLPLLLLLLLLLLRLLLLLLLLLPLLLLRHVLPWFTYGFHYHLNYIHVERTRKELVIVCLKHVAICLLRVNMRYVGGR